MSTFGELDRQLAAHDSVDYWEDEGIGLAQRSLAQFDDDGWRSLADALLERPAAWQGRCAQVLSAPSRDAVGYDSARRLLLWLVQCEHRQVRFAALDSLREMDVEILGEADRAVVVRAIVACMPGADRVEKVILQRISEQIGLVVDS